MTLEELLGRLESVSEERDGWLARCPAHPDSHESLRIAAGEKRLLLKCRAGCETGAVLSALGLSFSDLPDVATLGPVARRASVDRPADVAAVAAMAVRLESYRDAVLTHSRGEDVVRYAEERFGLQVEDFQRLGLGLAADLGGGVRLAVPFCDARGVPRGFQARALDADARVRWLGPANPDGGSWTKVGIFPGSAGWEEILVLEGPGDALTACGVGYDAIGVRGAALATNPGVVAEIAEFAGSRPVVVIGDADPAGDKFARDLAAGLAKAGVSVRKVRPDVDGDDLTDWRARDPEGFASALIFEVQGAADPGALAVRLDAWPDPAQTELAQAARVRDRILNSGSGVRFTPEAGFFLLRGGIWRQDVTDEVRTTAQEAAEDVWREADELLALAEDEQERAESDVDRAAGPRERDEAEARLREARRQVKRARSVKAFARGANSSRGIDAVVREMKALRGVAATLNDFDRRHDLLACRNGVVNLRTGELLPHDPALLLTRMVDVDYDPAAQAPRWERFLEEVFPAHPDLPSYMRRLVGYGVTGETTEQCFAVLYGKGANGKSVFTDTLTEVFREVTTTTPFSTFEQKPAGGIPNDLAALKGSRLVMASEGEAGKPMAEAVLKRVTGRDLISARFMRQEFFEFRPTFLIMLATNHKPNFRGQDDGLWRRVKLLPWERFFAPHERDHRLGDRLLKEKAGIVAWAVRGAVEWYAQGLGDPEVVVQETKAYRETSDVLQGFLPGVFVYDEEATTTLATLWQEYRAWADDEALPDRERPTRRGFQALLAERGLESRKRNQGIVFVGVRRARQSDAVADHDEPERADRPALAPSSSDAISGPSLEAI